MRLKVYTAKTMQEARQLVKEQMGDQAIIVSTGKGPDGRGVTITAAIEQDNALVYSATGTALTALNGGALNVTPLEKISKALDKHGVPEELTSRILKTAACLETTNVTMALAGALDEIFNFAPLAESLLKEPLMLVGPPGSGKTVSLAKLAAKLMLSGYSTQVISTDTVRAGGLDQLQTYTSRMNMSMDQASTPLELELKLQHKTGNTQILIDSLGVNPFNPHDMEDLEALIGKADVEPVLVLAAGGDIVDTQEITEAFVAVGVKRVLITRIDMTRRLGSILSAADQNDLTFCDIGIRPEIIEGMTQINPVSLAKLILPA
ncbi:MAG: hypothetical protein ACTSXQ_07520 [Alphaproteobacteria bacterium]